LPEAGQAVESAVPSKGWTRQIGLAALKFFIIKVQPQKRMTFNPKESVDMQGQTGPYIQNAYVRIRSVLRKAGDLDLSAARDYPELAPAEKELITALYGYPELIQMAANTYDPSLIANFAYNLAKGYHKFYTDHSILKAESEAARSFRLMLSKIVAQVLHTALDLLGIEAPEKM
jgi:arginyl-tRNA synthetase